MKLCAQAATVGVAVETGGGGKGSGASHRWQCLPLDQTRVRRWGCGGGSEPCIPSRLPHLLFIGTVRRGPTSHEMAGRPRSGRGQGVRLDRWVKTDEINSNILPLDLKSYFNLKL